MAEQAVRGTESVGGDKLRVLFVNTPTCEPMGADTWIQVQVIANLDRTKHEVHVALETGRTGRRTPMFRSLEGVDGLRLRRVNLGPPVSGRNLAGKLGAVIRTLPAIGSVLALAWYVRRQRVRVIHTSDRPRDAFACVVISRLTGVPCIVHVHQAYSRWTGRALKWCMRRADALIAISEFVGRSLISAGHRAERVHVVLNAIDLDRWQPSRDRDAARGELNLANGTPAVLSVSRLAPEKGPAELIRAVARARLVIPDIRLFLAGLDLSADKGFSHELAELVRVNGLDGDVQFLGWRDDIARLMAAADVYAMPSTGEPFGLVFAEAMAMRLPVVGLNDGGTPEVVEDGKTGLLSTHGDVQSLADNLLALLKSPDLRQQFGHHGRCRVESLFTAKRMARDVADVYAQVSS